MKERLRKIRFPSEVTAEVGFFDRMADAIHRFVSSAIYFVAGFLVLVLAFGAAGASGFNEVWFWGISLSLASVTFLMVAILENSARRHGLAVHHKLNAHSRALLALLGPRAPADVRRELQHSIAVEERESASGLKD